MPRWRARLRRMLRMDYDLYLMLLPALIALVLFHYLPMYGVIGAFKDFKLARGFFGSEWVGFAHFERLISAREFARVFRNTILINIYRLIFQFPLPIILAILINEVRNLAFKRGVQTITYLPHFMSWVIVGALFVDLLSPTGGLINKVLTPIGLGPITLMDKRFFRTIVVSTYAWKETGWSAIIYLAAITGIDPSLYEAAAVDGANKWRQMIHITLPGISSTIVFVILLRISAITATNVEQILMLYNPLVYDTGDVIGTYVYRVGIGQMKFSYTIAVGLFQSGIGFVLLLVANALSRRWAKMGMW